MQSPASWTRSHPILVINAAAYTAVDRAEEEYALAQRVNAEGPGAMARWCASHGVPLIHFSTDYVFDGHGTRPWSEDDPPRPLSAYGASKLAGEEQIRAAGGCFLIIRTSWIYAARGTNFLRRIAALAKTHKELRIVADQIGAPTPAALIAEVLCDDARKWPPNVSGEGGRSLVASSISLRLARQAGMSLQRRS